MRAPKTGAPGTKHGGCEYRRVVNNSPNSSVDSITAAAVGQARRCCICGIEVRNENLGGFSGRSAQTGRLFCGHCEDVGGCRCARRIHAPAIRPRPAGITARTRRRVQLVAVSRCSCVAPVPRRKRNHQSCCEQPTDGEPIRPGEIERAVERSKTAAWQPGQPYRAAPPFQHGRQGQRTKNVEAIIRDGGGLVDLWEDSPVRLRQQRAHTEALIDALFPGNPLLCCGQSNSDL